MKKTPVIRAPVAARVTRAIVRVSRLGGLGVVVPGGFVVTAAHCIGWTAEGFMALGPEDPDHWELIEASDGRSFTVSPYAVEPVSDIAVLGVVDNQIAPDRAQAFEAFCDITPPVPLSFDQFAIGRPSSAYVFTHDKGIIRAEVTQWALDTAILHLHADQSIEGGTSGGPVVTRRGRLLGVVSNAGGGKDGPFIDGSMAHLSHAVAAWLLRRISPVDVRKKLDAVVPPGYDMPMKKT